MSDSKKKLHPGTVNRRDFIKKGAAVTTAVAATLGVGSVPSTAQGAEASAASSTAAKRTPQGIPIRKFGKKGPNLPILGYGAAGLPTKWGNKSPMEYRLKNVRHAYDQGIRFFDTASNYGEASDIFGEALKDVRKDVYLVTKVHSQKPEDVRAEIEGELEKLGTDHVDAVILHGTPGLITLEVDQALKIRDELLKLRDEKLMKHVGVSSHSFFEKTLNVIRGGGFDLCMLSVGYISRGGSMLHTTRNIEHCRACVAEAYDQGMGIVGMKVIAAGMFGSKARVHTKKDDFSDAKLKELPGAAIRYVHNDPRITLQVIGMPKNEDIDQNVKTFAGDLDYTIADRKMLTDYTVLAYNGPRMSKIRIE